MNPARPLVVEIDDGPVQAKGRKKTRGQSAEPAKGKMSYPSPVSPPLLTGMVMTAWSATSASGGEAYGVPWVWGLTSIAINDQAFAETPTSVHWPRPRSPQRQTRLFRANPTA